MLFLKMEKSINEAIKAFSPQNPSFFFKNTYFAIKNSDNPR